MYRIQRCRIIDQGQIYEDYCNIFDKAAGLWSSDSKVDPFESGLAWDLLCENWELTWLLYRDSCFQ